MNHHSLGAAALLLVATACAAPSESGEGGGGRVLASLPGDVEQRARVDFGGAVELLGWDVEPKTTASPGSSVRVRLYLRSNKRLSPGWRLFTELRNAPADALVAEARGGGTAPESYVPGTLYLEERTVTVPEDVNVTALSLVAGFVREPVQVEGNEVEGLSTLRLPILSGLSDGDQRAVLASLSTGVTPGQKRTAKPPRRRPDDRRMQPGDRNPRPALSALRRNMPMMPQGAPQGAPGKPPAPKENP
jgi:hypothetical protein